MDEWMLKRLRNIFRDNRGMGTVEVILIIVVLIGLVLISRLRSGN